MLKLSDIKKDYPAGDSVVHALKGVSLEFRENEFVAVLGQSGCGKTTLLNIIGGLDQYTSGDLIINGRSTKDYKDRDWDTYRQTDRQTDSTRLGVCRHNGDRQTPKEQGERGLQKSKAGDYP